MTLFILEKDTLNLVDQLPGGNTVNGLNPDYLAVEAINLQEAQENASQSMIDILWSTVSTWAEKVYDADFRMKCLSWKYDPTSSAAKLARIADLEAWADSIWVEYYRLKAMYEVNDFSESFDPSVIASRPWSFIEVAST